MLDASFNEIERTECVYSRNQVEIGPFVVVVAEHSSCLFALRVSPNKQRLDGIVVYTQTTFFLCHL